MSAGLAGLLTVAACDSDAGRAAPAADPTTGPPEDADADLVAAVLVRIGEALAVVRTARGATASLGRELLPLIDLHQAHLGALDAEPDRASRDGTGDLRSVLRAETALQRDLVEAAVRAESGTLAKLFASMSAAVAQQLAVLA